MIAGISITTIIVWLIIGVLAGTAAGSVLSRGKGGYGVVRNTVLGLVGAVIGGFIFELLNIQIGTLASISINLQQLLAAFLGAILFVVIVRGLRRS
ncbi:MAG: GlsB/YeaQ/YmgE family stress response membrane protein [Chloroflexota bacterium]